MPNTDSSPVRKRPAAKADPPTGTGNPNKKRARSPAANGERSRSRSQSPPRKRPAARAVPSGDNAKRKRVHENRQERRSRSRTPPRKRPGANAAISAAAREEARQRRQEREREDEQRAAAAAAARGVHDVVRQHYNAVPERGREWRKTDSKIKGLRSFNNWVKSTLIQRFSPNDGGDRREGILVLDIGCGKGGDLMKWSSAPQRVDLYVAADPAEVSIQQARDRYREMSRKPPRGRKLFHAEFSVKDCFGEWMGDIPIIQEVGIDPNVGPGGGASKFATSGFDVVSMMFCMHYAFENEEKARMMLKNVSGALKKGGRFLGVIPNSDVLSQKVEEHHKKNSTSGKDEPQDNDSDDNWDPEKTLDEPAPAKAQEDGEVEDSGFEWGNSIYRVKFPGKTPKDGVFRPPFGWKYFYFLEEAVEEVPEYVVPWEAFRALAEDYNLELQYRKPFPEVWEESRHTPEFSELAERMRVQERGSGRLLVSEEEMNASAFYHAFCFYKV
ncbi:guanine-N(7)-methyltransferase [Pseudovirgaria hyperparasitica]|uniref:mRNA cap guanine-N(7) methyltransferase n=1 Tax=Pseudovirgaria hyperparasitica TaxID=470096 RepID=A0A6A6WCA6_9PEZI|nr:guanine-N(7)-methyltransferase [Pseudovirgaria hyperparasitica]KAF2760343.1 guanine-N(7)-methyltransferase [Pseudovirgaria hyperparasitica]